MRRFSTPLAFAAAVAVYVLFFFALAGGGMLLQVAAPALLALVAAVGVKIALGRTPAEITDDAYRDDAEAQSRRTRATLGLVLEASRKVSSASMREDLNKIGTQVPELLRRTAEESPNSLYSSAATLNGHLQSLLGVVRQYADIERNPSFYPQAATLLDAGADAVHRFRDFTLDSIRLINQGGIAEYRANLDTVAPPALPTFGGDA